MRISVDRTACELHGQCVLVAPDIFAFNQDDNLVYSDEVSEEFAHQATEAVSFCPAQAIRTGV